MGKKKKNKNRNSTSSDASNNSKSSSDTESKESQNDELLSSLKQKRSSINDPNSSNENSVKLLRVRSADSLDPARSLKEPIDLRDLKKTRFPTVKTKPKKKNSKVKHVSSALSKLSLACGRK
jgi:hypothetical protein